MNHVTIMGNLTRDPECRFLSNNTAVASLTIASTRRYTANGEKKEETCFLDCEAWSKTAELLEQYFSKGKPILVEGRLKTDQWQDKEGRNRSKIKLVIDRLHFLPREKSQAGSTTPATSSDDEPPF